MPVSFLVKGCIKAKLEEMPIFLHSLCSLSFEPFSGAPLAREARAWAEPMAKVIYPSQKIW